MLRLFSRIDLMVRVLLLAMLLAVLLPAEGEWRALAQRVSDAAIFVLFLLNGMRLERAEVLRGMRNLRFLLPLVAWVFGAMSLAGMGIAALVGPLLPPLLALGFLFLGTLPSTVQSATAYISIARGNVASSVVAAATLNILGVFVTAPLFSALGGGEQVELGTDALVRIGLILLLPFAIGQLLQTRVSGWVERNRAVIGWADRTAIGIAVYVAMSGAVSQGILARVEPAGWAVLLGAVAAFLLFGFGGAWLAGGALRLDRGNRIAFLFGGAQKSTAMGVPLASILFPPAEAGFVVLPLLAYHLLQMVVSAPIASRLAAEPRPSPDSSG